MARYRKIDPRIHNDEQFRDADPLHKLVWYSLLTHPMLTPMGAGVIPFGVFDSIIGRTGEWCWKCNDNCREHTAETILGWFAERSMIRLEEVGGMPLIIVTNFLLYNTPDNPNQLVGWIDSIEELPKSELWKSLRDHLFEQMNGFPNWLFDGLLNPLSENKLRNLKRDFWKRVGTVSDKPSPKRFPKRSGKPSDSHPPTPPPNQEQEQEQEQEVINTSAGAVGKSETKTKKSASDPTTPQAVAMLDIWQPRWAAAHGGEEYPPARIDFVKLAEILNRLGVKNDQAHAFERLGKICDVAFLQPQEFGWEGHRIAVVEKHLAWLISETGRREKGFSPTKNGVSNGRNRPDKRSPESRGEFAESVPPKIKTY